MELKEIKKTFENKINNLILKTPSGEIRNELSELNILFCEIVKNMKNDNS